ncbi:TPA: hypothetical protein N0F65_006732 [Lagenidium giganteum]|uniref:Uncharacterized protein n=1 Tax=Lagenidium giganteum TaxID=4803 RepID=A0AAV2YX24_9STRA|nr:TPA: hypothetical protein N0F65_006732 [Lagenidium giganteum]
MLPFIVQRAPVSLDRRLAALRRGRADTPCEAAKTVHSDGQVWFQTQRC